MQAYTFEERMRLLREKKIAHTLKKREQQGFTDADDYGTVPVPDDFSFTPRPNFPNGGIYGDAACAENFAALLDAHPVYVDPLEIMCGRWRKMLTEYRMRAGVWDEGRFPYDHLKPLQKKYDLVHGIGSDSHCSPDFRIGLELGFGGLLNKVRAYREKNQQAKDFYDAEETVILAIQRFIERHIEEISRQLTTETRPELRATLELMREANQHIVSGAPETFLEACQWISWYNVCTRIYDRDGAGCQLDVILTPYYERDKAEGRLDDDMARFILANLLLIETHYYQLSGVDDEGRDQTCALSWLTLEAAHMLNSSANLTVRVHPNVDEAYLMRAVEYLFIDGNGWPRFCGDLPLTNGYIKNGCDEKTARSRIAVGCNWMAAPGLEFPMNDCVKINIAKVFEVAYWEMTESGAPSVAALKSLFQHHLKIAVDTIAQGVNFHLEHQHKMMPELVINLMMEDTIEKGLDITQCPRLGTIGVDGAGLAVVADSFAALEQRIEREGRTTWEEVSVALKDDFAGVQGERLRLMLSGSERYCQGDSLGDSWAKWITDVYAETVHNQPMPLGRRLVPGWFSWSNTIILGRTVGATPNGRKAGKPISHGANPNPGFRKDGAATAQSAGIAMAQPGYGNTAPLQLEFDPRMSVEEGGVRRALQLIKTHFAMGGTLININVLDGKKLMEANENPDLHPDLVVRVTGFTAYFVSLSPEFRQLVVDRFIVGF
jgi:pyruvate-formate lyase